LCAVFIDHSFLMVLFLYAYPGKPVNTPLRPTHFEVITVDLRHIIPSWDECQGWPAQVGRHSASIGCHDPRNRDPGAVDPGNLD